MYRTKDQVALEFIAEGRRRNITPRGQVICIATGLVESELTVYANSKVPESLSLPHDAVGSDGYSVGPLQQQIRKGTTGQWWWGDAKTCMDPTTSSGLFYDRLAKTTYIFAGSDAAAGAIAQQIQQSAYPDRYAARMPEAQRIYNRLASSTPDQSQENSMSWKGDPTWLADVLKADLGDRLIIEDGWETRGTGNGVNGTDQMGEIWGVLIHHTGNSRETWEHIRDGRDDLPGPLSHCLITPDGKCHLIAIGPCNHAGIGDYGPLHDDGNQRLIAFECAWPTIRPDGSYDSNERWPDAQIITMRDATAAVLRRLDYDSSRVIGHKDYAGARQGKWDPGNIDMAWFRGEVQKDLNGYKFPGEDKPDTPAPGPALPPDYAKEVWDLLRSEHDELGGRTVIGALAELLKAKP